jgi:hypothetical protein
VAEGPGQTSAFSFDGAGNRIGAKRGRFRKKNRKKSSKFDRDFSRIVLIAKELMSICTEFGAGKSLFLFLDHRNDARR